MKTIMSIGELLIDFIPSENGKKIKEISSFQKMPGGAPANVCAQVSKLNGKSIFVGQVGKDGFGDYLKETLVDCKVDVSYLYQSNLAHTALAFVTLTDEGERDFIFYRNPSADQLLDKEQVKEIDLDQTIFHFCSLSLDDYPLKDAVSYLLKKHKSQNNLISFDPNLRLSLFENHKKYRDVILDFIPYADILKVSDDELFFITEQNDEKLGIEYLFDLGIKHLLLTRGKDGVTYFSKDKHINVPGFKVKVKDTTGAGDSWIGTFLSQIATHESLEDLSNQQLYEILRFANAAAAITTTKNGAIHALPTQKQVINFIKKHNS